MRTMSGLATTTGATSSTLNNRLQQKFQIPVQQQHSTPQNSNRASMYRLSSFHQQSTPTPPASSSSSSIINQIHHPNESLARMLEPHHSQQAEHANSEPVMTPTYESIDVQNLHHQQQTQISHHMTGGYDYCAMSGGGSSSEGQVSTSACMSSDPTVTVPENHRLYPVSAYDRIMLSPINGGAHHLNRSSTLLQHHLQQYYPHPSDSSTYYGTAYGHSSGAIGAQDEEDYDIFNAIFTLISLTSYVCCFGGSLMMAYFHGYHEKDRWMCGLTLTLVLIPSIIVNIISLKWLLTDNHQNNSNNSDSNHNGHKESVKRPKIEPCGWMCRIMLHILLLGPILRYVELLRYGVKSWSQKRKTQKDWTESNMLPSLSLTTLSRTRYGHADGLPNFEPAAKKSMKCQEENIDYFLLTVAEDRDTSLLSLFYSLMHATLQIILQLCSLLTHQDFEFVHNISDYNHHFTEFVQFTVIGLSMFEVSWSLASYHRALRRASYNKRNQSPISTMVLFVWQGFWLGSRLLAITLFIHRFSYWICPVTIGHWGVMTIWLMHQGTSFFVDPLGRHNQCAEYMFDMLIGAIFLFVFINVKDEPTRYKYLAYYAICLMENSIAATLWFYRADLDYWLRIPAAMSVLALFMSALLTMQLYYWCFHPNGRPLLINKAARCC